jgi:hypothetical protein
MTTEHRTNTKPGSIKNRNCLFKNFPQRDDKGRQVGVEIITSECDLVAAEDINRSHLVGLAPGHYFCCMIHATRSNIPYGAMQPMMYFTTEAKRNEYIDKRVAANAKIAAKKWRTA